MRIKSLQKRMQTDVVLFISFKEPNPNMMYFAGYSGKGILAITKRKSYLLIPEYESYKSSIIKPIIVDKKKQLLEKLKLLLKNKKTFGIEESQVSVYLFKKIKKMLKGRYKDVSHLCSEIRMIKEPKELSCIKKACKITDNIFLKICKKFNFKTEDEIRNFIIKETKKNNCELAFPPIAASGKGTSIVHYEGRKKLTKGFLMLDFGVKYKGYCSDMTRMLYLGEPSKKELENYELVLKTIKKCEKDIVKHKRFNKSYELAIKQLGEKADFFTHSLGHGLGLEIHEQPSLFIEDKTKIQNNIVFTIEPGIYFPNKYGIRIEDTVLIVNNTLEVLTKSNKKLVII